MGTFVKSPRLADIKEGQARQTRSIKSNLQTVLLVSRPLPSLRPHRPHCALLPSRTFTTFTETKRHHLDTMPGGVQKDRRPTRHHTTRKRKSESHDEESCDDIHAKVRGMCSANTTTNTALVKRGKSPAQSEQDSTGSQDFSESEAETPKRRERRSSDPFGYIPTEDELRRYEYFHRLKASATMIPAKDGHTYDEVNVGENARVIQGNAFAEECLEAALLARKHHYKRVSAVGNGEVIVGDVTVRAMKRFFHQHKKHRRQKSKSSMDNGFRYGDPVQIG